MTRDVRLPTDQRDQLSTKHKFSTKPEFWLVLLAVFFAGLYSIFIFGGFPHRFAFPGASSILSISVLVSVLLFRRRVDGFDVMVLYLPLTFWFAATILIKVIATGMWMLSIDGQRVLPFAYDKGITNLVVEPGYVLTIIGLYTFSVFAGSARSRLLVAVLIMLFACAVPFFVPYLGE